MKRIVLAILMAVILASLIAVPANAVSIQGVYYNFNAAPNEPAITFVWGSNNKPPMNVMGDQFQLIKNERTLVDIEARIQAAVYDVIVHVTPLSQIDPEDPIRQDPPILTPAEKIMGNKLYTYEMYFAIHIYSLDNPATPESELRFTTRFQYGQYGDITGEWW